MSSRRYYSTRTGKNPLANGWNLPILLTLFKDLFSRFNEQHYFQQAFGYECIDDGNVPGTLGTGIEFAMLRAIKKPNLWPIEERCLDYTEDDLFDVIEFLYDNISKPVPRDGDYHSWGNCGWHYKVFDENAGREEYRREVNKLLADYEDGFELSVDGEILALPEQGFEKLLEATIPNSDHDNVNKRIESAIQKFRRYRSSMEDRKDAIRDLADVLEYLRPQVKSVLTTKDESDLFNIANNFGIRHHNSDQKTEYDKPIWYSWMFYYYLATIHAALRLLKL
ncbi:MAG: hypothetical protein SF123_04665 [Chloroflexota bacterium]|nr:hypothetical protein [Chloroflexota bacterium]